MFWRLAAKLIASYGLLAILGLFCTLSPGLVLLASSRFRPQAGKVSVFRRPAFLGFIASATLGSILFLQLFGLSINAFFRLQMAVHNPHFWRSPVPFDDPKYDHNTYGQTYDEWLRQEQNKYQSVWDMAMAETAARLVTGKSNTCFTGDTEVCQLIESRSLASGQRYRLFDPGAWVLMAVLVGVNVYFTWMVDRRQREHYLRISARTS